MLLFSSRRQIQCKSPQSQQATNKQLQWLPPHSPRRAYKRPVLKPKAAPDPVSQTLAALKEPLNQWCWLGWGVDNQSWRWWVDLFTRWWLILYDFCLMSIVFLSFSGYLSSRHTLFFPPIGHPSSHLVSDQGLLACILEFENICIINMIQHQINSSSTDHHEHPWAKTCFYQVARTQWNLRFVSSPEQSVWFSCFCCFKKTTPESHNPHDDVASGKERGFIFLDVWSSVVDVPNPWHLSFSPFETWFQYVPMTLTVSAFLKKSLQSMVLLRQSSSRYLPCCFHFHDAV